MYHLQIFLLNYKKLQHLIHDLIFQWIRMDIREATSKDMQSICKLSNEINDFHNFHMPHMFKKAESINQDVPYWMQYLEKEQGVVFVAQQGVDIVGAICAEVIMSTPAPFLFDRRLCFVGTIVVSEKYQKTGAGKALMAAVEEVLLYATVIY